MYWGTNIFCVCVLRYTLEVLQKSLHGVVRDVSLAQCAVMLYLLSVCRWRGSAIFGGKHHKHDL